MGKTYKENRDKYRKHLQKKDKKSKWKKPQPYGDEQSQQGNKWETDWDSAPDVSMDEF